MRGQSPELGRRQIWADALIRNNRPAKCACMCGRLTCSPCSSHSSHLAAASPDLLVSSPLCRKVREQTQRYAADKQL